MTIGRGGPHEIGNSSIEEDKKSLLLDRTFEAVYAYCKIVQMVYNDPRQGSLYSPLKSRATMSASSVGETDIQTPSKFAVSTLISVAGHSENKPVVRIELPGNEVSTR